MSPGARARICVSCRTLLDEGESCPGKKHQTISLRKTAELEALEKEVWGRDSAQRAVRRAARDGAKGGALGSIFEACNCSGLDACDVAGAGEAVAGVVLAIVAVIVFAVVFAILAWVARQLYRVICDALERPRPEGALFEAPRPANDTVAASGVILGGKPLRTPWKPGSAFAYAFELYEKEVIGGSAMLREARTGGLEVALDDGRTLRVPEGRVRIVGPRVRVDTDASSVGRLVAELDPDRDLRKQELFPHDFARALTLGPGDRVDVLGEVRVEADPSASGYRSNAAVVVPVGVPVLRVRRGGVRVAAGLEEPIAAEANEPGSLADEERPRALGRLER